MKIARTAAVALVDPLRRYPPPIDDERVFQAVLLWLETGTFPASNLGKGNEIATTPR